MPTRYAQPVRHIQYRNNIRRKGTLEAEMIWDSEAYPPSKKAPMSPMSSPVSVADFYVPEIKPLSLPDSWTVVGKNGKPLKGKMYDDPKKKKKRNRKPKSEIEAEPLADLVEAGSSSKCLQMSDLMQAKHMKATTRARDAKYWANYRDSKEVQRDAHAALNAIFSVAEHARARAGRAPADQGRLYNRMEKMEGQMIDAALEKMAAQDKDRRKSRKGDSLKERMRRSKRSEAASEHCYSVEENEDVGFVIFNPTARQKTSLRALASADDVFWALEMPTPAADRSAKRKSKKRAPGAAAKDKFSTKDKRKMPEGAASSSKVEVEASAGHSPQAAKKVQKKQNKSCNLS